MSFSLEHILPPILNDGRKTFNWSVGQAERLATEIERCSLAELRSGASLTAGVSFVLPGAVIARLFPKSYLFAIRRSAKRNLMS